MKPYIKEKIQEILKSYDKIVLFQEDDCHFGTVFHAAVRKYSANVITANAGGGV